MSSYRTPFEFKMSVKERIGGLHINGKIILKNESRVSTPLRRRPGRYFVCFGPPIELKLHLPTR